VKPHKIGVQSDGKIIGFDKTSVFRILTNGQLDPTFKQYVGVGSGNQDATPTAVHIQKDDKIIFTGTFDKVSNQPSNCIARVDKDGNFDSSFDIGTGPSQPILASQLTDDGKILIGGLFWKYDNKDRNYVARLTNATGPLRPENLLVSVKEMYDGDKHVEVYPNPASGFINVDIANFSLAGENKVELFDMTGRKVYGDSFSGNRTTINLSGLTLGGSYLLLVSDGKGIVSRKKVILN
jgi:hypothetical protein